MKRLLFAAFAAFLALGTTAFAQTYTRNLPLSTVAPSGDERVPVDTYLSQGRAPQTKAMTLSQLQGLLAGTLTDAATVTPDFSKIRYFRWTLGGNRTFGSPSATPDGSTVIRILAIQDSTGNRTVTWSTGSYKWAGVTAPTLTTTANHADLVTCIYDAVATHYLCDKQLDYTP